MARSLRVQSQQLSTESQIFEDEVLARTASAEHPTEEMSERHDHSKNLIGTIQIRLFAKRRFGEAQDHWPRFSPASTHGGIRKFILGLFARATRPGLNRKRFWRILKRCQWLRGPHNLSISLDVAVGVPLFHDGEVAEKAETPIEFRLNQPFTFG